MTPSSTHLTRAELEALTDTVQPKRMCAWLEDRAWVFERPGRRGEIPKVARAYHDARMSGRKLDAKCAGPKLDFMSQQR